MTVFDRKCCPILNVVQNFVIINLGLNPYLAGTLDLIDAQIDVLLSSLFRCGQEFGNPRRGSQLEAAGGTGQGDQLCRVPHQTALVIKVPKTVLYCTMYVLHIVLLWNKLFKFEPVFIII
jgi:hypothetical protein